MSWFEQRARPFPWRTERTPYRVWVAEAMLQQTRAETVVPYFLRWMDTFPTVSDLARAEVEQVLAAWEGLGYYRRAHALHRAARRIVTCDGGRFPSDEAGWRSLPGVGPYTAAAVAAFALGHRTVAVDGNVRRVGARLRADAAPVDAELRQTLAPLLPASDPARGTEALIELGATVCSPRAPDCGACPLRPGCAGAAMGEPTAFPARLRRASVPTRRRWALVALDEDRIWLERRPEGGLLGGLWGVPQRETAPHGRPLPEVRHAYSHFALRLVPVLVDGAPPPPEDGRDAGWSGPEQRARLPLSKVDRMVLSRLREAGLLAS
ncbi:MAG: NUDIX domain-containing protein [Trueperaceae bacterium]|nr:NUDIX domain-containing protein [Trueperaceae bacterium]